MNGSVDITQGVLGLRADGAANLGILQAFLQRHPRRRAGGGDGRLHGHDGQAAAERQRA
ncbi:MAG: hypothetical protein MZV64_13745 [Ignavibacteriales bacterium]|nr:hypothetical protein [Ignavibacteriales bacterium]